MAARVRACNPLTHQCQPQLIPVANKPILFRDRVDSGRRHQGMISASSWATRLNRSRRPWAAGVGVKITHIPQEKPWAGPNAVKIARPPSATTAL